MCVTQYNGLIYDNEFLELISEKAMDTMRYFEVSVGLQDYLLIVKH